MKKLIGGLLISFLAAGMLATEAGALLSVPEKTSPGCSSGSGSWIVQLYNSGNPEEGKPATDYGIDYSAVSGVRFTFAVDKDDVFYELFEFEGHVGGAIVFSCNGGDIYQYEDPDDPFLSQSEVWTTYNWASQYWWGINDEELDISTDPLANDDPDDDGSNTLSTVALGDMTYSITADVVNPLSCETDAWEINEVACMQLCFQDFAADALVPIEITKCEVLDAEGNVLIWFDGNGNPSLENIASASGDNEYEYEYVELSDGTIEITKYTGDDTEVEIPSEIGGKTVTSIVYSAFEDCTSLTSVAIPNSVTSIYDDAFRGCTSLASVTIPDSVTSIGNEAFYDCTSLKSVTIPKSVNNIGEYAFSDCSSLTSAIISDGVTSLDGSVFSGCTSLTTITIPESVTNIGSFNFSGCYSLKIINVDVNNKYYASENGVLFNKDKTTLISFPNGKIATKYTIPGSVKNILDGAFASSTKLESITIPDSVTEIGYSAFWNCLSLTSLSIPDSVTTIGDFAINYYLAEGTGWPSKIYTDFMITCYKDSAAHKYATDNEINFTLLSKVTAPTAMKGFKLGGRANNALRLNWTKNTSADGYIIEQYNGSKWVRVAKIASNATTTYKVTGLKAGTAYKFRMRAYKMDGSKALYSAYTSTLAARTNPSNITGYKLGGRAADALRLNWTKNTSADGYIVEQYKSGKWVRIAKITSNATTTYKISGLKASTEYKFRVRAYKMSGKTALYSGYSSLSAYTSPSNVANLKITGKATTALRLGWSKNTSADGYIVEMYKDGKWVRATKIASNATVTFRKSGLKKGTTYKFRVRTYNMVGKTVLYGNYVNVSGTTNK